MEEQVAQLEAEEATLRKAIIDAVHDRLARLGVDPSQVRVPTGPDDLATYADRLGAYRAAQAVTEHLQRVQSHIQYVNEALSEVR